MNKCIFMGNLSKDFEVGYSANGLAVGRSSLALNRGKDKDGNDRGADFINLVAFGNKAETMERYGKKGKRFLFETHVQTGSYEKDGRKVYTTDFVVDRFEFADSANTATSAPVTDSEEFMHIPDGIDDELPFE